MTMRIRTLRNRGRIVAAISVLLLLSAAIGTSQARADEALVAYASTNAQQQRQARVALDVAINGAAERANAALTQDVRLRLDDSIQIKLRVANVRAASRG